MPYKDPEKRREYLREASRRNYLNNKDKVIERTRSNAKRYKQESQDWLLEHLRANPCVDCGETDPVVLEFDHRDDTQKLFNIGDAASRVCLARIVEEVSKCDVRCANCHRRMTYRRAGRTHRG